MRKTLLAVTGAVVLASVPVALAVPTLTLYDPGTGDAITIVDGLGGDGSIAAGSVSYVGAVGPNWTVNISVGTTKPTSGSALAPALLLNDTSTSVGAGTLNVFWSDTDFGALSPGYHFEATAADTSLAPGGSFNVITYGDTGNTIPTFANFVASGALYNPAGALGPTGNDGVTAQSSMMLSTAPASATGPAPLGGPIAFPYSLTIEIDLTHTTAGTSQPSGTLTAVPDGGSSLMLLGSAFAALGVFRLRRKV